MVIAIAQVYPQCARALQRSELGTSGDLSTGLRSIGHLLTEASDGSIDASQYDIDRAKLAHLGWW